VVAEAYLLSEFEPIYAIYIATITSLVFTLSLPRLRLKGIKFARFAALASCAFAIALMILSRLEVDASTTAGVWYATVILSTAFHRWVTTEIIIRHLNPAVVQSHFSYQATSFEVGTVAALGLIMGFPALFSPHDSMLIMVACYLLIALWLLIQFAPTKNLEVHFEQRRADAAERTPSPPSFAVFFTAFASLIFILGALKVTGKYTVTIFLKEELGSYSAIRDVMADYYLVAASIVILLGILSGRWIQRRRTSPLAIIGIHVTAMFIVGSWVAWSGTFAAVMVLAVVRRVGETCAYSPGVHMVVTSFTDRVRIKLRAAHNLYFYPVVGLPLVLLYHAIHKHWRIAEQPLLFTLMVILPLGALLLLPLVRRRLIRGLYDFVEAGTKSASIVAASALSFLRPKDYGARMGNLLSAEPKKVLRKTIILGLGYLKDDPQALDAVMREFNSDKEEIQIAVLDALHVSNHYRAIQFLMNIMLAKELSSSLRVRMNAAAMIAGIYGRKAIPFLLNGLDDHDHRVVANTLEVLALFRDRQLRGYFEQYAQSKVPRVKANAMMGLARFRATRAKYREMVRTVAVSDDNHLLASVLYVIGKLQADRFENELDALCNSSRLDDPMVRRALAWALTRLDDTRGFELFADLFGQSEEDEAKQDNGAYIHFFAQLSRGFRLDLIKYFAMRRSDDEVFFGRFEHKLKHSHFDFHEEISYLRVLRETVGSAMQRTSGDP